MADMFADRQLKDAINKIIDNKGHLPNEKGIWFAYTKIMLTLYPAIEVYNLLEQALSEVSNENWFEKNTSRNIGGER